MSREKEAGAMLEKCAPRCCYPIFDLRFDKFFKNKKNNKIIKIIIIRVYVWR